MWRRRTFLTLFWERTWCMQQSWEHWPATSQLFLFVYHYSPCLWCHNNTQCVHTYNTSVPPLNNCGYDIILILQFIFPSFQYEGGIGHFILNIVNMKEKCVYIVNTLKGIKPKEYTWVTLTSFKCIENDDQQTNSTDCGFLCCFYMYRVLKIGTVPFDVSCVIKYGTAEYQSFITMLVSRYNRAIVVCRGEVW